jgi:segregation and condensation protein B
MKRKKQKAKSEPTETVESGEAVASEDTTQPGVETAAAAEADAWDGPTHAGTAEELAELAAESARVEISADAELGAERGASAEEVTSGEGDPAAPITEGEGEAALEAAPAGDGTEEDPAPAVESAGRLENIVESLLFAADRALTVSDLKRLVAERDGKKITAALEALRERHATTGIHLASVAGGWQFRTSTENAPWVSKLVAGKPQRLSRAMLETLAIVAYRQPVTRPEIDEIRGVDCGPVLKTLLDRALVRILGKKEEVGRPLLYGTTPEFLKTFSLKDLSDLPTLREFHELSEQQKAVVDAQAPLPNVEGAAPTTDSVPARSPFAPVPMDLAPVDQAEEDELLEALESATTAATRASGPPPSAEAVTAAPESGPEA